MLISFLYPFRIREVKAPFLWVFYKQLAHFKPNEITYIANDDYFVDPTEFRDRWEITPASQAHLGYCLPTATDLSAINKRIINNSVFDALSKKFPSSNGAWKSLITERYEPLEQVLDVLFSEITAKHSVEAVLAWCNCRSLSEVSRKYGFKIIHNELGPTRRPHYIQTAYFDFSGVNGNTDAHTRYLKFSSEVASHPVDTLPKKGLLYLLTNEKYLPCIPTDVSARSYDIGLALQIEDDSNVLAYSNGHDNFDLINCARKVFGREDILIRRHPSGHLEYKETLGVIDDSPQLFDFLHKCRRIATINSSVGFESILFDKITYILGDSPFAFMAYNRLDTGQEVSAIADDHLAINFIVFGYLIPYDLLFTPEYYRWRLGDRTEREIYEYHFNYYLSKELTSPDLFSSLSGKDLFVITVENKVRNLGKEVENLALQLSECQALNETSSHNILELEEIVAALPQHQLEQSRFQEEADKLAIQFEEQGRELSLVTNRLQQKENDLVDRDEKIRHLEEKLALQQHNTQPALNDLLSLYNLLQQHTNTLGRYSAYTQKLQEIIAQEKYSLLSPLMRLFFNIFHNTIEHFPQQVKNKLAAFDQKMWKKHHQPVEISPPPLDSSTDTIKINTNLAKMLGSRNEGFDVVVFPVIDWHFRFQRPQHLAKHLAAVGHRVFYLTTEFTHDFQSLGFKIAETPEKNVFIIQLVCPLPHPNIYRDLLADTQREALLSSLKQLRERFEIKQLVSLVDLPFWRPVLEALPDNIIVYDCMDYHAGFSTNTDEMLREENLLLHCANLVVTTSQRLSELVAQEVPNVLIRNGAEVSFFANRPKVLSYISDRPVVGYIGAISNWYDIDLVITAATAYPEWDFVLIGSTWGCDLKTAELLPNIKFLGEKPYADLPGYLHAFDVCIIPFLLTELTLCTNPVKVYEYLSAGKPVVATAMPELQLIREYVHIAETTEDFVEKLKIAIGESTDQELAGLRSKWAQQHDWQSRAENLHKNIMMLLDSNDSKYD